MKLAQVKNGTVVNLVKVDPNNIPDWGPEWVTATIDAEIGGTHDGTNFTPRPRPPVSVERVKAEAERRILAIMDKNKQRNLLAHGLEAIFEHGPDPAQWPAADRTLQQNTMPKWRQIKAIRAASDALEVMNPIPDNYTNDIHWP